MKPKIQELENANQKVQAELETAKETIKGLDTANQKVQQLEKEKTDLENANEKAKDEETTLEEQLEKKGKELETAKKEAEEKLKQELEKEKEKLKAKTQELEAAKREAEKKLKQELEKEKEKLKAKTQELEAVKGEAENKQQELQTQSTQAKDEKTTLEEQLKKKGKELETARYTAIVGMSSTAGLVAFIALKCTVRLDIWVMVGIAAVSAAVVGGITYAVLPSTRVDGAEAQVVDEVGRVNSEVADNGIWETYSSFRRGGRIRIDDDEEVECQQCIVMT
ncbi:hypothetical protein [Wolbachia endosymbiont (group A) of Lasioglossum fulvicorne]|uniref:hypothetical protein n=1 Tax=Wolbachia endosymbiont (group A) of Lasioglossum fulvicorne TaxID=3066201 RepID=UPI003342D656